MSDGPCRTAARRTSRRDRGALDRLLDAYAASGGPLAADRRLAGAGSCSPVSAARGTRRSRGRGPARRADCRPGPSTRRPSVPTPPAEDLVLVAISASGRTPRGRRGGAPASRHRAGSSRSRTTRIRRWRPRPIVVLPLLAGEEAAGIATRTFRATVAVLGLLVGHWGGAGADRREPAADRRRRSQAVIDGRRRLARRLPPSCSTVAPRSMSSATPPTRPSSTQAALMLREAPRLPASAHDTGDWLHTGVYLALPGHRALLFAGAAGGRRGRRGRSRDGEGRRSSSATRRGRRQTIALPSAAGTGPLRAGDRRLGRGGAPGRRAVATDRRGRSARVRSAAQGPPGPRRPARSSRGRTGGGTRRSPRRRRSAGSRRRTPRPRPASRRSSAHGPSRPLPTRPPVRAARRSGPTLRSRGRPCRGRRRAGSRSARWLRTAGRSPRSAVRRTSRRRRDPLPGRRSRSTGRRTWPSSAASWSGPTRR